jgi:DNA-binding CsgD family transcriptional regulator
MAMHDRVLALLQQLYAAPGRLDGWHTFLVALCAAVDGNAGSFISHHLTSNSGNVTLLTGADQTVVEQYAAYWGRLDPWIHSPKARVLTTGFVGVGDQLITHADMQRTAYYQDFARHYDLTRSLAGTIEATPEQLSFIAINGGDARTPFGRDEVALLTALMPHLARALQLHRRIAGAAELTAGAMDALDRLPHALALVSQAGRVLFVNRAAEALLGVRDGLTIDGEELRAGTAADTNALRAAIRAGADAAAGMSLDAAPAIRIQRPSGRRPYAVLVAPATPAYAMSIGAGAQTVIVAITDPERRPPRRTDVLRAYFGLSRAEADVALAIVDGGRPDAVADRLCLSVATVRTHLRRLFAKTGTARQADLVRALLAILMLAAGG